jgi:Fe-Mn family superoxide dismutase
MNTRRSVLKTIALATGSTAIGHGLLRAQAPSNSTAAPSPVPAPNTDSEGVFKLPPLGYDYDALEPFIDAETMKLHHDKHHATYVSKLNQAIAKAPDFERQTVEQLLASLEKLPETIRNDVRNHGGGHSNHTLFWQLLRKQEKAAPSSELAKAIDKAFGSFSAFEDKFTETSMKLFGSGWVWLAWIPAAKKLEIQPTPNQDSPIMTGAVPLMGIDLWEHAYYLKHQNRRADYIKAFTQLINWGFVSERFSKLG